MILSQDCTTALPYGHFILKVMNSSDIEFNTWEVDDAIYPWFIIAMIGREDFEILGRYETKEQAITVMQALVGQDKYAMLPTIEHLKDLEKAASKMEEDEDA